MVHVHVHQFITVIFLKGRGKKEEKIKEEVSVFKQWQNIMTVHVA